MDSNGDPLSGALLYTYTAGSSTPETTYTTAAGNVANANPIVLLPSGYPGSSGSVVEIWLTSGISYKFILKTSAGVTLWTRDNISGVNDAASSAASEWVAGAAPTYISATSFSLVGDQTSTYTVGRRVKTTNSGGTVYSRISASAFAAVTTITVVNDSGTLDSGLSAVSYGLLSSVNPSIPVERDNVFRLADNADPTKLLAVELGGLTAAVTRTMTPQDQSFRIGSVARSYLAGCTLSTAGSSATMSIAAGQCSDTTNVAMMELSAIAKTTSAWSVGTAAGGIDTGAIANATWYHFYVIMRLDTSVTDVIFTLSASTPALPANYTLFRRIGSGLTNGSAQWTLFVQDGDLFQWAVPPAIVTTTAQGTSAVSQTFPGVPTGVNVMVFGNVQLTNDSGSSGVVYLSDLATTDTAASATASPLGVNGQNAAISAYVASYFEIRTNTAAAIRSRLSASGAATILRLAAMGWKDRRGRDA